MILPRVLIVEDDCLIALDLEAVLIAGGYTVCGVARSEKEALAIASITRPEMAVVDVGLSPGDGRVVAKALCQRYATVVLFATGQCGEADGLAETGAVACLPKPYAAEVVPGVLCAIGRIANGDPVAQLPRQLIALAAA